MKLSTSTLNILKNFATINPSMYFKPGKTQKSICVQDTILAKVELEDDIETEFCVYDLPRFMNTLSLFDEPDIEVDDKYATIGSGKSKIKYTLASKNTIKLPPEKEINVPTPDIVFTLTNDMLQNLFKATGVLSLPDIAIVGNGSELTLQSLDSKNKVHDNYVVSIGDTDKTFKTIIKAEKLKLLPMDYKVSIARLGSDGLSHFKGSEYGLEYWVSIEPDSKFE